MKLDDVGIATPCERRWDTLEGTRDADRRYCDDCDKHVHDLSELTAADAQRFREEHARDGACVRFRFDADGRVIHRPPAAPRRLLGRLGNLIRGAALGAGLAAAAGACQGSGPLGMPTPGELKTLVVGKTVTPPHHYEMAGGLAEMPDLPEPPPEEPTPEPDAPEPTPADGAGTAE